MLQSHKEPMMDLKISTWNPCLGMANKKDTIKKHLNDYINFSYMQENGLPSELIDHLLQSGGWGHWLEKQDFNLHEKQHQLQKTI